MQIEKYITFEYKIHINNVNYEKFILILPNLEVIYSIKVGANEGIVMLK